MLLMPVASFGQERMVLGPRQFERDTTGKGAVLCTWGFYIGMQAHSAACGLSRTPTDDAIDEAIGAMDDFIIANSSLKPTRGALEQFKRAAAESELADLRKQGMRKFCTDEDLNHFRSASPEAIRASIKRLLEIPREPVMNPCL